jgi:hypothetical protein
MTSSRRVIPRGLGRLIVARPQRAVAVASSAWHLRRRHWWKSWPFIPVPGESYFEFRRHTANREGDMTAHDVVAAAQWSLRARSKR